MFSQLIKHVVHYISCLVNGSQLTKMETVDSPLHFIAMKFIRQLKAVALKIPIILLKIWFLWICEIWGYFVEIWYFPNNCLIKVWIWKKKFLHILTHLVLIIYRTPHFLSYFLLNRFSGKYRFPFPILQGFFTIKSPSVTQRSVSQENAYKKSWNSSPFLRKAVGSDNDFTPIENNFRFWRYSEVWIQDNSTLWSVCKNAFIVTP